jgi:CHASE2 domain-containing sensor protein
MKRKKLWSESLWVTLLTTLVLWIFYLMINISFQPLNYIVNTISSINLNDLWFSSVNNNTLDTSIVLVNAGDLDREGIAFLIDHIAAAKPRVIGLDIFFSRAIETSHDSLLEASLYRNSDRLVLSYPFQRGIPDSGYWILNNLKYGHAMLTSDEKGNEMVRDFSPVIESAAGIAPAFAVTMASLIDLSASEHIAKRNRESEIINYIGSTDAFLTLQHAEVMSGEVDHLLHKKTVMVGYLGNPHQLQPCLNDLFFTPVGFNLSTNRRPDMYGLVIHANILSMILNERYIQTTPPWIAYAMCIVVLFLHLVLFVWLYLKLQAYFQAVSLLILGLSFTLILWGAFMMFSRWHLEYPTALLLTSLALAPNILPLYEIIALLINKRLKWKSLFVMEQKI